MTVSEVILEIDTNRQAHQQLKEELGLDHFEKRSWHALHRHALMTVIAYAFLQHRGLTKVVREKKNQRSAASAHVTSHPHAIVDLITRSIPRHGLIRARFNRKFFRLRSA